MTSRSPFGLLALLSLLVIGAAGWRAVSFTFEPSGKIWIEGTSTVHDWDCQVGQFAGTLDADVGDDGMAALSGTTVVIPVSGIDCDNGTMNGKLRNALGQAPVRFTLTRATLDAPAADGWFGLSATGHLTIAGATQAVTLPVKAKALDDGRFRFTGRHALLMTDYDVDPPTALLGTLKTGDEITVHFDVTVSR